MEHFALPLCDRINPGTRGVRLDDWRKRCAKANLSLSESTDAAKRQDAEKTAFKRSIEKLADKNIAWTYGEYAWLLKGQKKAYGNAKSSPDVGTPNGSPNIKPETNDDDLPF